MAEEIFAVKGQEAASVREICARAGANIAAVNYHFGTKERLYIETVKAAHCTTLDGEFPQWPPGTPPADKLRDFIRLMVRQMFAPTRPSAIQLVMRELALPSAATQAVVQESIRPMAHVLREIVRQLRPDADEKHTLMTGFSVIGQVLYYRQNRAVSNLLFGEAHVSAITEEMAADHITRFTLAALGFAPPITAGEVS